VRARRLLACVCRGQTRPGPWNRRPPGISFNAGAVRGHCQTRPRFGWAMGTVHGSLWERRLPEPSFASTPTPLEADARLPPPAPQEKGPATRIGPWAPCCRRTSTEIACSTEAGCAALGEDVTVSAPGPLPYGHGCAMFPCGGASRTHDPESCLPWCNLRRLRLPASTHPTTGRPTCRIHLSRSDGGSRSPCLGHC
jgi:hypothetical protein